MTLVIKNINPHPFYRNRLKTTNLSQVVYFEQTFPTNTSFITINKFTGSNPDTLLYDFIYAPCDQVKGCSGSTYSGWLQYTGEKQRFYTIMSLDQITWQDPTG